MTDLPTVRKNYPRVSDITGKQTETAMRAIPLDSLLKATERGTEVHTFCTSYMNQFFLPPMELHIEPYVKAFINWANENIETIHDTETRLYDDDKRYSGQYDALLSLKNRKGMFLMDIKTSSQPSPVWPVQLAAYQNLCAVNGIELDGAFILHLKQSKAQKNPTFPIKATVIDNYDLKNGWDIFSHALSCYDYFDRNKEGK